MREMTARERLLNAITGRGTDRVPWAPFLAYYWESLDEETKKKGQFEYLKAMGADPLMRGDGAAYQIRWGGCDITTECGLREKVTT